MNMTADSVFSQRPERHVRRLWWYDRDRFARHLLRLSPEDRYLRFGGHMGDETLAEYARRSDWPRHVLLGAFIDGELRGVGECRFLDGSWPPEAELAFSVETPHQGQGLGTELFRRLVIFARNRGVRRVYVTTLRGNVAMRRIAGRFGMVMAQGEDELEGRMELLWPTGLSVAEEALNQGQALWSAGWVEASPAYATPESAAVPEEDAESVIGWPG